jgi:rare lipoprotein A
VKRLWIAIAIACAVPFGCGGDAKPKQKRVGMASGVQTGKASWYGGKFHGGPTASGETYNKRSMTAAHRSLPFGTRVRVTNMRNGRSVIVRINNRGPYSKGRIIDLSEAAAEKLDMIEAGVVPVRLERL